MIGQQGEIMGGARLDWVATFDPAQDKAEHARGADA